MNDAQAWAIIGLLASMMATLALAVRGDRKELRAGLDGIRNDLSEVKVIVARMDERLKGLEARFSAR